MSQGGRSWLTPRRARYPRAAVGTSTRLRALRTAGTLSTVRVYRDKSRGGQRLVGLRIRPSDDASRFVEDEEITNQAPLKLHRRTKPSVRRCRLL